MLTYLRNNCQQLCSLLSKKLHWPPLSKKLHWLPVFERMKYKVALKCFRIVTGSAPVCLSDPVTFYTSSCCPCSSSHSFFLCQRRYTCKYLGYHSFSFYAPELWNYLPFCIKHVFFHAFPSNTSENLSLHQHLRLKRFRPHADASHIGMYADECLCTICCESCIVIR